MQKKALGKGLEALIKENIVDRKEKNWVTNIPLENIKISSLQPRKNFSNEELQCLAESIKNKGVIQPILVRQKQDKFELIAGERRYRSAKLAQLKTIPAIVKQVSDEELLQLSLIENVQRENLTPVEEALAYKTLQDSFGFSQQDISNKVGKDRSTISNYLRILTLPEVILDKITSNALSFGHAKAILALKNENDMIKLCNLIVSKSFSVREAENFVSRKERGIAITKTKIKEQKSPEIRDFEEKLSKILGTKIQIKAGGKKGKITIEFYSDKDLERILNLLIN